MISIIIPTYNESELIGKLINFLKEFGNKDISEIIISDGGSTDNTAEIAKNAGAQVIISPQKGRAAQMNFGASMATSDILYFIHADTLPPPSFFTDINQALKEGFELGRYRTRFQSKNRILQFNAFFTRFDLLVCYGGDQTFFITKKLFKSVGGFNADMQLMEDYDIVTRARALARYKIFQKDAKVSARKYENNTWLQVQRANFIIVQMYKKGASQESLAEKYRRLLTYRKG